MELNKTVPTSSSENKLIDNIPLPDGLRSCSEAELSQICKELREELISTVSESGGHFASSLGATELTVALHTAFNTPNDRLIWDVGHQGYIHKMLTGRRDKMSTIRQINGLSGFLRRDESVFDCFGAGHAGTSISAGVGMRFALQRQGLENYVVPIIGDGSLTSGMAFEALNHAGSSDLKKFIVVLNDNEMSISPNVGALSWLFSKTLTGETSTAARRQFKEWYRQGYIPEFVYKAIDKAEEAAQGYFCSASVLFEAFGFRYIGPVDGHNISELLTAFENAKLQDVPVVVHARTKKGKGYEPAEQDPLKWHGVIPFDPAKAEFKKSSSIIKKVPPSYTEVFSKTLVELAKLDPKIIGITAAMPTGTGLDLLEREIPEQFLDVGISEQHAVTCAAGMAAEGFKPVCAIYSTFLQRAYDQIIHDVCIQRLPVIFAIDRGGTVGNDGETHQGLFDLTYLRVIPELTVVVPKDEGELRDMLFSSLNFNAPIAFRFPRGASTGLIDITRPPKKMDISRGEVIIDGQDIAIIGVGPIVNTAAKAAEIIKNEIGLTISVVNARSVKPLDEELLKDVINKHQVIITLEDNSLIGGFGSAILELAEKYGIFSDKIFHRIGAKDFFTPHASQQEQYEMHGYDLSSIVKTLRSLTNQHNLKLTA